MHFNGSGLGCDIARQKCNTGKEILMTAHANIDQLRLSNEESRTLSRESMRTALMKLMADKSLEKISINEIVNLAGVSRMAFYRNYGTKETLAEELCLSLAEELERDFKEGFAVEDKESWYVHFFETMYARKDYLKIILSRNTPVNEQLIVSKLFPEVSAEEHYFYVGRGGALFNILKEWYLTGMKESPEEMGSLCNRFFSVFR